MLQPCLKDNRLSWWNRRRGQRRRRHFQCVPPPPTRPNGTVRVTSFKLHPHVSANLRNHICAHLLARQGYAGLGESSWRDPYIGNVYGNSPELVRVNVVKNRAAVNSVVFFTSVHTLTVETEEPTPPRASVKFCL